MALSPGTRLGPYEIVSSLGAGGMGEVYRARDMRLDRTVAIKILPEHLADTPEARQRFEREAKSISALNHPHICVLHDIGSQDRLDFLVMECVEGETLASRLAKGALPLEQALLIGQEIADALDKAHRAGITHRDLKPANVMLTKSGAKLMDFGLAKTVGGIAGAQGSAPWLSAEVTLTSPSPPLSPVTTAGTIVGTIQYMSPEQLQGREADARSDIFALGAVLYEMVTGKRAFEGKSQISVASAILERDPEPITVVQPTSPPQLDRVIRTCLAKDPDERFQTAHDLRMQLRWIAEGSAAREAALPALRGNRAQPKLALVATVAVAVVAVALLAALWLLRPEAKHELIQAYIAAPEKNTFALADDDLAGPAVISPAGHYLAFVAKEEGGKHQIWIRDLAQNLSSPLVGTEGGTYPFWSPHEDSIGFFAEGKLKRAGIHAGTVLSLCDVQRARGGSWGVGGDIIFTADTQTIISVIPERGGIPRPVTRMESYHTTHRWPIFLPDGRHFLYLASNHQAPEPDEHNGIYVSSLDGRENRFLVPADSSFAVSSDYLLFLQNGILMTQQFDPKRAQLLGSLLPMGLQPYRNPATWRGGFDASTNELLVYHPTSGQQGPQLFWFDRSGKPLKPLAPLSAAHSIRGLSLSPDAHKLAVVEADTPTASVWIYDAAHGTRSRFTFEGTGDDSPKWSADGSQIAFAQRHGGPYDIYVKNANGTGSEELIFASPENKVVCDWTPDGRNLLIGMGRPAGLWLVPLSGEKKARMVLHGRYAVWGGAFSPDGHWLAYFGDETGRNEVYITRFPSLEGKWQVSNGGGRSVSWRRDEKAVFYMTQDGTLTESALIIHGEEIDVGAAKELFKTNYVNTGPLEGISYAVTPDAQRFLITRPEVGFSTLNLLINWTEALKK